MVMQFDKPEEEEEAYKFSDGGVGAKKRRATHTAITQIKEKEEKVFFSKFSGRAIPWHAMTF